MSPWDKTSMELPSALSGSKELMACPGVASTCAVPACVSGADTDWAVEFTAQVTAQKIVTATAIPCTLFISISWMYMCSRTLTLFFVAWKNQIITKGNENENDACN